MWFVYFIQAEDGGPVKIGCTGELRGRIRDLQVGNPQKLRVVETISCGELGNHTAHWIERTIHQRLQHLYVRGEWFRDEPSLWEVCGEFERNGVAMARRAILYERHGYVDVVDHAHVDSVDPVYRVAD